MDRHKIRGHVRPPSLEQVKQFAAWSYLDLSEEEAREYRGIIGDLLSMCDRIDELPQPRYDVKYPRTPGYKPSVEEDPLNAFITKCEIKGASSGKLAGKKVGIKDNIAVAGVPLSNGNRALADMIPDFDAVVVERVLDAGATIIGKFNQDDYSFYGTSDTSTFGQVRNPMNPDYSPGGSSSAQGVLVRAGYADIALGVDQAGSGRIPAGWAGVCSIKATHGLVPSFGIFYLDHTLDHICPAAKTVGDVALALEVLAGEDPRDPQWIRGQIQVAEYTKSLMADASGLRIGVVKESMHTPISEADVDECVLAAVRQLEGAGATVSEVSIPLWPDVWTLWCNIFIPSITAMMESVGQGYFHNGFTSPTFAQAFGAKRRLWSQEMPPLAKIVQIMGLYLRREYDNVYYCKGQNLRHVLNHQLDDALADVDVLVTPTTPIKPSKLFDRRLTDREWIESTPDDVPTIHQLIGNTAPTDITGHPSLVMPCGIGANNLPISIQFIGKRWNDATCFRVGYTYESLIPDLYRALDQISQQVLTSVGARV